MPYKMINDKIYHHPVTGQLVTYKEFLNALPEEQQEEHHKVEPKDEDESDRAEFAAPMVVRDIEPYKPIARDVGGEKVIGGRRQHRDFLRRNGYTEIGNEMLKPSKEPLSQADRVRDIKRAIGE